jgi:MFS family permease
MVFVWLLWGDFVSTLLDGCVPAILPLKLNQIGAGDFANQMLNRTFGFAMAFMFAPAVSFASDRRRGRLGRRIPFLLYSTPFVGLFLILIGCYDGLTSLVMGGSEHLAILGMTISRTTVTLVVFGVLFIGFDFANIFVGTIYWYLFNDVVPPQFLSRFLSLFRMVGTAAGVFYNLYVFPSAITHFRVIFVVAGIAYFVGFTLMCIFVKEGSYPPPPQNVDKRKGLLSSCKTYAKECFTHRLYWYFFLANACTWLRGMTDTFQVLRNTKSLGFSLGELGVVGAWCGGISFLLQYPAGWISDKYSPVRTYFWTYAASIVGTVAACVWIFVDFGHHGNLIYMYATSLVFMPLGALNSAAELPMYMRLLPKDRYGQFCSANAAVRAFAMIFGSMAAGAFMEKIEQWWHMGDWHYRFVPAWSLAFQIPAIIFLVLMYREWKARGGDKGYTPPLPAAA